MPCAARNELCGPDSSEKIFLSCVRRFRTLFEALADKLPEAMVQMGRSPKGTCEIDCHLHLKVVAGLTGGDADDLQGEPALIPLTVHP